MYRDIVHTTRYVQNQRFASIRSTPTGTRSGPPLRAIAGHGLIALGRWLARDGNEFGSTPIGSRT